MLSPHLKASLRLVHPSMPSPEISQGLEADSKWGWSVGERRSPAGDLLTRLYRNSYWVADLNSGGNDSLVDLLAACLDRLEGKRNFLLEFRRTGGRAEFFVGWFRAPGEMLPWSLLERVANLGWTIHLMSIPTIESANAESGWEQRPRVSESANAESGCEC